MALPASGTIKLSDIKAEFGGNANAKITDYYAGGAFVPAGTTDGAGNAIPSSGTIKISNFYGASKELISITSRTISDSGVSGQDVAVSEYHLLPGGGSETKIGATVSPISGEWNNLQPNANGAAYECRATLSLGVAPYGSATGSWLPLSSVVSWGISASAPSGNISSKSSDILVEIRKLGTTTVLASATISLRALVTP